MARTALTVNEIDKDGLIVSLSAANADGHSVAADRNAASYIEVLNGSGSSITVTIQTPATAGGLAIADRTVSIGAGVRQKISLEDRDLYVRDDGTIYVDFSAVTTVTCGAFKISKD
jgi:hypothetical protein